MSKLAYARLFSPLFVEFFGSFLISMTLILGECQRTFNVTNSIPFSAENLSIVIGFMMTALIFSGADVSGGHFNPSISIATFLSGKGRDIPFKDSKTLLFYIISQLLGSIIGGVVGRGLFITSETPDDFTIVPPAFDTTENSNMFGREFLFTTFLCYAFLNVMTTKKSANNHYYGLVVGFCYFIAGLGANAIVNPATTTAVYTTNGFAGGDYVSTWYVLMFGQLLAAPVAAILFYGSNYEQEFATAEELADEGTFQTKDGLSEPLTS